MSKRFSDDVAHASYYLILDEGFGGKMPECLRLTDILDFSMDSTRGNDKSCQLGFEDTSHQRPCCYVTTLWHDCTLTDVGAVVLIDWFSIHSEAVFSNPSVWRLLYCASGQLIRTLIGFLVWLSASGYRAAIQTRALGKLWSTTISNSVEISHVRFSLRMGYHADSIHEDSMVLSTCKRVKAAKRYAPVSI
ncbi:hypothetical protein CLF_109036 [Clonorchis sinensis]|uniref:Uncharacterized protein n=1 Tax=Clonorchis sinensis TaxID=79923 RepID=G7YIV0_CLOSI|nr:hypothetical protein CLF_109036 [Clonorchis sinensis]